MIESCACKSLPNYIYFQKTETKKGRERERERRRLILAMFMPTEQHHHTSPSNIKSGPLLLGHCHQPNTPLLCSRPHRPGNTLTHFPPRETQKQKLQNETQMRDLILWCNPWVFLHIIRVRAIVSLCCHKPFLITIKQPFLCHQGLVHLCTVLTTRLRLFYFLTPRFIFSLVGTYLRRYTHDWPTSLFFYFLWNPYFKV